MSIEACIAHAIQSDLDILEAIPEISEIAVDELEPYVERFVLYIQEALVQVVHEKGECFIRSKDAAGLCATCLEAGINIPPKILLRMCQTIVQLSELDAQFILDTDEGTALYYVKMQLA